MSEFSSNTTLVELLATAGDWQTAGDSTAALAAYERALPLLTRAGHPQDRARALFQMAQLARFEGQVARAFALYDELLPLAEELADHRARGEPLRLLDIRTREEWDAVHLDGAEFVNQELVQSLMGKAPRDALLVFYDHDGSASLDAAAYFAGHGFTNAKYLRGGIDAWAQEVDAKVPRYKLESA